jgi:hypothetical protein
VPGAVRRYSPFVAPGCAREVHAFASDNEAGISNTYDPGYNYGPADCEVTHTFVELDLRDPDRWFDTSCFVRTSDVTGTCGNAGRLRGPGSFNIDASLIKHTKFGRVDTEFRVEAFNLLNHPQFAQPNTTFDNASGGKITAMLSSPSCSLCGTTERQVQLGFKMPF